MYPSLPYLTSRVKRVIRTGLGIGVTWRNPFLLLATEQVSRRESFLGLPMVGYHGFQEDISTASDYRSVMFLTSPPVRGEVLVLKSSIYGVCLCVCVSVTVLAGATGT